MGNFLGPEESKDNCRMLNGSIIMIDLVGKMTLQGTVHMI
jgi:hypothetical protein